MTSCAVVECGRPAISRGWCNAHYNRWKRYGNVQAEKPLRGGGEPAKLCSTGCGRPALARTWCSTHYNRWKFTGQVGDADLLVVPRTPGTTERPCTVCAVTKPIDEFYADRRSRDGRASECKACAATKQANNTLRRKYGLTTADKAAMSAAQNDRCPICDRKVKLVVDHCHKAGHVRALLCDRCNRLLGVADDDINLMRRAITFLELHSAEAPVSA